MSLTVPAPGTICPALAKEPFVTVIYGYPGVGKTPVIAALPDCDYYDLQLGTRYSTVNGERILIERDEEIGHGIAHFEAEVAKRRAKRRTFTVVDPITVLYDWAVLSATEKYTRLPVGKNFAESGCRTILDLTASDKSGKSFAPGYRYVREEFMRLVRLVWPQRDYRVIFVGHVRDAMMADVGQGEQGGKTTVEFDGKDLDIDGKLRNIFLSECDLALYAYQRTTIDKGQYVNTFTLTSTVKKSGAFVKCRCPHLIGKMFAFGNPATLDD